MSDSYCKQCRGAGCPACKLEGPPDPEACSCDEALGLRKKLEELESRVWGLNESGRILLERAQAAEREWNDAVKERDTFRDMARQRGELLVTEVERRLAAERACTATTERLYAQARTMIAAESRLAEATALLRRWWASKAGDETGMPFFETGAFLSAAPAQAAEPERGAGSGLCHTCGSSLASLYEAAGREHPDTRALRECRAELNAAHEFNARETETRQSDIDAAREAGRAEGRSDINKYSKAIGEIEGHLGITSAVPMRETVAAVRALVDERNTALARIAQAVAELESVDHPPHHRIERALEALP